MRGRGISTVIIFIISVIAGLILFFCGNNKGIIDSEPAEQKDILDKYIN